MSTFARTVYRAGTPTSVTEVLVTNLADIAKHATNYWTFSIWKIKDGEQFGARIASFSTQQFKIEANDPVTVYDDERGTLLDTGDSLRVVAERVGSPAALSGASFHVRFAR